MVEKQAVFEIIWSLQLLNTSQKFHAAFLHQTMERGILRTEGEGGGVIYILKSTYPEILSSSPSSLLAEDWKQKGSYKTIVAAFGSTSTVPLGLHRNNRAEIRTPFM